MNKKKSKLKAGLIAGRQKIKPIILEKKECMLIYPELLLHITCNNVTECAGSELAVNFRS